MTERLRGVWVAMPTPWQADGSVDAGVVEELVGRYAAAGLDGAYTTGTDGEFHVMELPELESLVEPFARAAAKWELPVQVGCGWSHTQGVIDRARVAESHGVTCIQTTLPSWIPLADDEVIRFYAALQEHLPATSFIHYNIARSGRMLTGEDYRRILGVAPNLIGSKQTGGNVAALMDLTDSTPELDHFVVDGDIVAGALFGSPGFYSFIANLSPGFALEMMAACQRRDWEIAAEHARLSRRFFRRWLERCPDINSSAALGKIATRAGIFPEMPLRIKEPYSSGTERHVAELRELVDREFPELALGRLQVEEMGRT